MKQRDWDVAIVGAGLAGSTAAWRLAEQGQQVLLLEKNMQAHHKVCGEFLSADAQHYLAQLGLNLTTMGAVPISHVRLCAGRHQVKTLLPYPGLSMSRYLLDEALIRHAEFAGATVLRGARVTEIYKSASPYNALLTLQDRTHLHAKTLMMATGKLDAPGQPPRQSTHPDYLGLKLYFNLSNAQKKALQHTVEVMFFGDKHGSYAGLQPVENGRANLCMVVHKQLYAQVSYSWFSLLQHFMAQSPLLAQRLSGAEPVWSKPLALSGIPYGFVYQPTGQEWFYRLGDQLAVIPSFCGQGMAMALHTAFLATAKQSVSDPITQYYQQALPALAPSVNLASALFQASCLQGLPAAVINACKVWPGLVALLCRQTALYQTSNFCYAVLEKPDR